MATLSDLPPNPPIRPLRRVEYERLAYDGHFDDERVELLDGFILRMSPSHPAHAHAIRTLLKALGAIGDRAVLQCQQPLSLGEYSLPEPDLAVLPPGDYRQQHPAEALLVIEVSASSIGLDRGLKKRIYGRAGIPEYWIVNIAERTVEVYSHPHDLGYGALRVVSEPQEVAPGGFPDVRVAVRDLLP